MKHLIMGTAGHVDHGKTALIKALTGTDCDTHKEEKQRGITINLGFANLSLSEQEAIGIIDVPGHRDFIHTMVGGAAGIDFVLLVIAADSGIMPQTREHLNIMKTLGVKHGLIALTKTDLLDPELLELTTEEVQDFVQGTFLEKAPIIGVSAKTGSGLAELKQAVYELYQTIPQRSADGAFRLFADRVFSVAGFGTVVTGSVISGSLKTGATVYLLPGDGKKELRVRRLERHGQETDRIVAGDRASLNLVGLEKDEFERGMMISDQVLQETNMIDAHLQLFEEGSPFELWTQVVFHLGTFEAQAKIHLMDKEKTNPGEEALVQIKLQKPCVINYGDRFVIRNTSSEKTLGGGEVIDPLPLHHKRRTARAIEAMEKIAAGDLSDLIVNQIYKHMDALSTREIAGILNLPHEQVLTASLTISAEDIKCLPVDGQNILLQTRLYDYIKKRVLSGITGFHKHNSFTDQGLSTEALLSSLSIQSGSASQRALSHILNELLQSGELKKAGHTYALSSHQASISDTMQKAITLITGMLKKYGMQVPLLSEIIPQAKRSGIDEKTVYQVLAYLTGNGQAYKIEDSYIHTEIVNGCRQKLLTHLANNPQGLRVAAFRDLVGGNRKICLLLLSQYDSEGITERNGDVRVITDRGRKVMN
ncbi:selenocysteine-specific translation elongation factor [Candidatus Margulisiibacteriota bacterium]